MDAIRVEPDSASPAQRRPGAVDAVVGNERGDQRPRICPADPAPAVFAGAATARQGLDMERSLSQSSPEQPLTLPRALTRREPAWVPGGLIEHMGMRRPRGVESEQYPRVIPSDGHAGALMGSMYARSSLVVWNGMLTSAALPSTCHSLLSCTKGEEYQSCQWTSQIRASTTELRHTKR